MNSNLFQQVQTLDSLVSSFQFLNEQVPNEAISEGLKPLFGKLNTIMSSQKQLFYELERQVSSKVDRFEFS